MELDPTISHSVKIVAIGDPLVGKSCAITKFSTDQAPIQRQSTVFDSTTTTIVIEGRSIPLSIWDTTGKNQYKGIRQSVYNDADIIYIFFSVSDPTTLENAIHKWLPQANQANSKALKLFIGTKIDLRNKGTGSCLQEGSTRSRIQQQCNCQYFEMSGITGQGIKQVFQQGVLQVCLKNKTEIDPQKDSEKRSKVRQLNNKGCCLLM